MMKVSDFVKIVSNSHFSYQIISAALQKVFIEIVAPPLTINDLIN